MNTGTVGNTMLGQAEIDLNTKMANEAAIKTATARLEKLGDPAKDSDAAKAQKKAQREDCQKIIDGAKEALEQCEERIDDNERAEAAASQDAIEDTKEKLSKLRDKPTNKKEKQRLENAILAHETNIRRLEAGRRKRMGSERETSPSLSNAVAPPRVPAPAPLAGTGSTPVKTEG